MRKTIAVTNIPLWPLVKNTFIISLILLTILSFIFSLLWFGLIQQFSQAFSDPAFQQFEGFQSLSGGIVFFFAIFNGVFGSIVTTVLTGLAGLIYNMINSRGDGIEFEIVSVSEPEEPVEKQAMPTDEPKTGNQLEERGPQMEDRKTDDDQ